MELFQEELRNSGRQSGENEYLPNVSMLSTALSIFKSELTQICAN